MNVFPAGKYLFLLFILQTAYAGNALMISPIDPRIENNQQACELWLENRGTTTTMMQIRVFSWQQSNGQQRYQTQQDIQANPPMVHIDPGQKQVVRLVKKTAPLPGREAAYRVVLDEIPAPDLPQPQQQPPQQRSGLSFQMRYSLPLFVYGAGLSAETAQPMLRSRIIKNGGKTLLEIINEGTGHARLSDIQLDGRQLSPGLFGYVLAQSRYRWPLPFTPSPHAQLVAELNKKTWRSAVVH